MADCVNCGKNLGAFSNYTDPFSVGRTCKSCAKLLNSLLPSPVPTDFDLAQQREKLKENGITESGLAYISERIAEIKHRESSTDLKIAEAANAAAAAAAKEARASRMALFRRDTPDENGVYYHIEGARGRVLDIYYDKCVITTNITLGSIISNNATDGEKTIYYVDCTSLQYKRPGLTLGYLQLETAGTIMNNKDSNFFSENSFTFNEDESNSDTDVNVISTAEKVEVVVEFIKKRLDEIKRGQAACSEFSVINALKRFKELLDTGAITQEEFDAKKKQLLGF